MNERINTEYRLPQEAWVNNLWTVLIRKRCIGHLILKLSPVADGRRVVMFWRCSSGHNIRQGLVPLPIESNNLEDFLNEHFGTEVEPNPKTPLLKNLWEGIHID